MSKSISTVSGSQMPSNLPAARSRRRSKVIVIQATAGMAEKFQEVTAIEDIDYLTQAIGFAALFNGAIDNVSGRFDPAKARMLIDGFNTNLPPEQARYKLGIFNVHQTKISQTNSVVSGMIDKILGALKGVVGVALGTVTVNQLTAAITDAFTDLQEQKSDAWIFWQKKDANKTTYSYAILFAFQDATTGHLMFVLPMSLEIEVEVAFEKVLWITIKDKESYSVKLDVMKVGQLLYPKSPGSDFIRAAAQRSVGQADTGPDTVEADVTNIRVTNWAKTKTYATAPSGQYSKNFALQQIMTNGATVTADLFEGTNYLLSYTLDGNARDTGMLFNGEVGFPQASLWFVTQ